MPRVTLTAIQWTAWFSPNDEEREAFREEMRARIHAELLEQPHSLFGVINDGGILLARVHRDGRLETTGISPRAGSC